MDVMKFCSSCREEKPSEEFHHDAKPGHGRQSLCKPCKFAYTHTPEALKRRRAAQKKYRIANRDKCRARWAAYYAVKTGKLQKQPCF